MPHVVFKNHDGSDISLNTQSISGFAEFDKVAKLQEAETGIIKQYKEATWQGGFTGQFPDPKNISELPQDVQQEYHDLSEEWSTTNSVIHQYDGRFFYIQESVREASKKTNRANHPITQLLSFFKLF